MSGPVTVAKNAASEGSIGNTLHEMGEVSDNGMVTTAVAELAAAEPEPRLIPKL